MSSHVRLAGGDTPSFLNQFFNLRGSHTVADLIANNCSTPLSLAIDDGIDNHPILTRIGAPLLAGSYGVVLIAIATALFAESLFKGLANLLIGVVSWNSKRLEDGALQLILAGYGGGLLCLKGLASATFGIVGLAVAPAWTYKRIIAY